MNNVIYCFNNGGPPGFMQVVAIDVEGNLIASHLCSNEGFMRHDIGVIGDWKHDTYDKAFGEGNWELEWVSKPDAHDKVNEACRLAEERIKEKEKEDEQ